MNAMNGFNGGSGEIATTFRNEDLGRAIAHLEELREMRRDFIVNVNGGKVCMEDGRIILRVKSTLQQELGALGVGLSDEYLNLSLNEVASRQLADKLDIPGKYWEKMQKGHEGLLDSNVNYWLEALKGKKYMFRSYVPRGESNGVLRAVLSDQFLAIENLDYLMMTLQTVKEVCEESGIEVRCKDVELTDKRLFARFWSPTVEKDALQALREYKNPRNGRGGGGVFSGFVMSNSETGHGKFQIAPRMVVGACSNGMIFMDEAFNRVHVGAKQEEGDIWSEGTKKLEVGLIMSQTRDAVRKFLSAEFLGQTVEKMIEMREIAVEYPVEIIENISFKLQLSEKMESNLMRYWMTQGENSSLMDVSQAMTFLAHDLSGEDRYEVEKRATDVAFMSECDGKRMRKRNRTLVG